MNADKRTTIYFWLPSDVVFQMWKGCSTLEIHERVPDLNMTDQSKNRHPTGGKMFAGEHTQNSYGNSQRCRQDQCNLHLPREYPLPALLCPDRLWRCWCTCPQRIQSGSCTSSQEDRRGDIRGFWDPYLRMTHWCICHKLCGWQDHKTEQ